MENMDDPYTVVDSAVLRKARSKISLYLSACNDRLTNIILYLYFREIKRNIVP